MTTNRVGEAGARWLVLIHQLPPRPAYVRVKVGRRLAQLGAVALKNTVYVLPASEAALEDFQWVRREIVEAGGEASVLSAQLVDGQTDAQVEAAFRAARDADFAALCEEVKAFSRTLGKKVTADRQATLEAAVGRFEARLKELVARDFFVAPKRAAAVSLVKGLRQQLSPRSGAAPRKEDPSDYRGRTWVTRTGVHVDRIASAWLIRRSIDPRARFKFVAPKGYLPGKGELRFDMFDAEFTHEGERCTFEVLCQRFGLAEPGLAAVAEIIHDIDLKDSRFGRPETEGVAALVNGLAMRHRTDQARLAHGSELFEQLLTVLAKKAS